MAERGDQPTVRTSAGEVSGRREDGLDVFRGIPFAEPPVGELRFAAPWPASSWDGVRNAFEFGPPPPQDVGGFRDRLPPGWDPVAGERDRPGDWLTVNVWTPSADSPGYDAQHIARDGDVVVVTFNYRVGIEGFAVIAGAPANRGLLDQVAALEWVRDNIAGFGGDPGRVTVAGESAGAGCIAALLAMPRADGLFRRAIVASMPGTFLSAELGAAVGAAIAAERGLGAAVAELAAVPPHELVLAGESLAGRPDEFERQWGRLASHDTLFAPVVDGEVLPTTPWEALRRGSARGVDVVVGHTRDECRLFLVMRGRAGRITESEAARALAVFGPGHGPEASAEAYAAADQLRRTWTTFATTGDPGWPGYDPERRLTQIFDSVTTVSAYPEERSRLLWRDLDFSTLPLVQPAG
jgi:para-nitrobenzyl esterase